jgi:hypothetical protein
MMPVGQHHVVTFFDRPRLVSLESRKVVYEWKDIDSGQVVSSIVWSRPYPTFALDPLGARFAVGGAEAIDVVAIDLRALPRS